MTLSDKHKCSLKAIGNVRTMQMKWKRYISALAGCAGALLVIVGCLGCSSKGGGTSTGNNVGGIPTTTQPTTPEVPKRYNAEAIVVVTAIDKGNQSITVENVNDGSSQVLTYNGGTMITSKYGTQLLMEQISIGEIAWIGYISGTQKLLELKEYDGAWENTLVTRWDVDYDKKLITIGSSTYSYDDHIFITSKGQNVDIREISGIDELTVRGVGNKAHSVVVDKGHGYVKLTNTANYVGGVVEIGDRITTFIVQDMIIAAPEGTYELAATIDGVGGSKNITVMRGQETIVSLSSFEQKITRYSTVKLNILPADAEAVVTIDGVEMDYSSHMSIAYGKHKLKVMSNNYDTVEKTINISSVYTTININMDPENSGSGSTSTEQGSVSTSNPGSTNGLICITGPLGASVYFDGAYMGTAPCSFKKVAGEHTIVLKKEGYATKSYTVEVSDDNKDMVLNFPEMQKE